MKKLFIIICALVVGVANATNENVPTSKKFVDAALAQKQPRFDGLGNDKLMLYSDTTDGVVASRDIVTTLGNSTSANTVPTVGAINTGLNTKQDILNGDAGWVAENTGIAGVVAQKPVYSATNNYGNALVEVETLNNAVINAVNSELTVVPGVGWTINTADNLNLLPVPKTYSQLLPNGYTQLEYLESTGTQWIDTNYKPNNLTNFEIKYLHTQFLTGWRANVPYGCTDKPDEYSAYNGLFRTNDGAIAFERAAWGNNDTLSNMKLNLITSTNVWYTDKYLQNKIYINGELVATSATSPTTPWTASQYLRLFARGSVQDPFPSAIRVMYAKAWENNDTKFNLIPARRNSDNALGMYDTVSGTFFTNAGTGTFTAGPVAN